VTDQNPPAPPDRKASFQDVIREDVQAHLTLEQAKQVRVWRVESGGSWRWVASKAYYVWDEPEWLVEGNQLYGIALCEVAAELLGEDAYQEPWN
jgi:hypothetical protein